MKKVVLLSLGLTACVTTDEGRKMQDQILELQQRSLKMSWVGLSYATKCRKQADDMRRLLDENKRLTVSLADASKKAERVQMDIMQVQRTSLRTFRSSRQLQRTVDYRSQSDNKAGTAQQHAGEESASSRKSRRFITKRTNITAGKYPGARYMLDAFVARYPTDARAARAQSMIGDSRYAEANIATRSAPTARSSTISPRATRSGRDFQKRPVLPSAQILQRERRLTLISSWPATPKAASAAKSRADKEIAQVQRQGRLHHEVS